MGWGKRMFVGIEFGFMLDLKVNVIRRVKLTLSLTQSPKLACPFTTNLMSILKVGRAGSLNISFYPEEPHSSQKKKNLYGQKIFQCQFIFFHNTIYKAEYSLKRTDLKIKKQEMGLIPKFDTT